MIAWYYLLITFLAGQISALLMMSLQIRSQGELMHKYLELAHEEWFRNNVWESDPDIKRRFEDAENQQKEHPENAGDKPQSSKIAQRD
jgi:hypothetical protein